jgi:ribonuclease HI
MQRRDEIGLTYPTAVGRSTKESFEFMPTRIRKLIGTWSGREASCAGREVLIKAVAQAVPTYPMSCFLIPKDTCKKMKSVIANYWWGSSADSRKIHWQRWDLLTMPKVEGGIGFRDLELFNLAMLGKQGWRILQNPESLCARILKGRYFHDTNFLQATRKNHSSHTWRAILQGREVLTLGLIRRIGNGESTNVWTDRWLPNHFSGRPITTPGAQVNSVSDLLTPSGVWNADLIKQLFYDVDVHAIQSVPIRGTGDDSWAWEFEKLGHYSVKSAYRLLYSNRRQDMNMNSDASTSGADTWTKIWSLTVPPKVRVFWWRVVNNFLPTRGELHRRHIEPLANCEVCGSDCESIHHVLLKCTPAKAFWQQVKELSGVKVPLLHPVTWAKDLIDPKLVPRKNAAVILCGMWSLWMARNCKRHNRDTVPLHVSVRWALDTAFDLWQISHPEKPVHTGVLQLWKKPPEGWIKCNVDAKYCDRDRSAASGVVLRDNDGRTCGGTSKWYEHCLNALTAEARACCDGLRFAQEQGFMNVQLETDCQVLVNLWDNRSSQKSEIAPILDQLDSICRSFQGFSFCFINRNCNKLAHECAKLVSRSSQMVEWQEPPSELANIINLDCNPVHP